ERLAKRLLADQRPVRQLPAPGLEPRQYFLFEEAAQARGVGGGGRLTLLQLGRTARQHFCPPFLRILAHPPAPPPDAPRSDPAASARWRAPRPARGIRRHPPKAAQIALMGKVCCKVDATFAPVKVGDLLTTSSTTGHAMKATNPMLAFGAVIGKALE